MERNEAIEVIKKNYPHVAESGSQFETALRILIPELKESIDERIKKVIKQVLNESTTEKDECYLDNGVTQQEVFAWLEKQGEQKPNHEIDIPFGAKDSELIEASYYIPEGFHAEIEDNRVVIKKGEQKPADEIKPKFNVGDYIERKDGLGCHAKIIFVGGNVYGCEKLIYSEDSSPFFEFMFKNQDEFQISSDFMQNSTDKVETKFKVGQTIKKEGFNLGFTIVKIEDGFYYNDMGDYFPFTDQDNWELVNPNPTWSEEDEAGLADAIWAIEQARTIAKDENDMGNLWYAEHWLESLKDRYTWKPSGELDEASYQVGIKRVLENPESYGFTKYNWKPSDEQIDALEDAIADAVSSIQKNMLNSLYSDLKKL